MLVSGQSFTSWARANIPNPAPGFRGNNWVNGIVTDYGSPAFNEAGAEAFMFGGGHDGGSYNGAIRVNLNALHTQPYSVAVRPTPSAAYPPPYLASINTPLGIVYPSGAHDGAVFASPRAYHATFRADLTHPDDLPYNAPESAPISSHAYGTFEYQVVGGVPMLSLDYLAVANANLNTGRWVLASTDLYAKQLDAMGLRNYPLQQGTKSHFDAVTGQRFVTCTPGDAGVNARSHLLRIDPATNRILAAHGMDNRFMGNATTLAAQGRKLWLFPRNGTYAGGFNGGTAAVFDMDTHQISYYTVGGDPLQYLYGSFQESIPAAAISDTTIARWNHGADRNAMYLLDTRPVGGAGTLASPYLINQTRRALTGMPTNPYWQFRLMYVSAWRMFVVHHGPETGWYALRLGPV